MYELRTHLAHRLSGSFTFAFLDDVLRLIPVAEKPRPFDFVALVLSNKGWQDENAIDVNVPVEEVGLVDSTLVRYRT